MSQKLQTLAEFIEQITVKTEGTIHIFPKSAYVKWPGFRELYVRYTVRWVNGKKYEPVLDIARVHASQPGKGAFRALMLALRVTHPTLHLMVECVHEKRFADGLARMGFVEQVECRGNWFYEAKVTP
jgi:hypothetical protein